MIYKIKMKHSQGPFWLFTESEPGWYEMFSHTGSKISLWVKKEVFDERVANKDYVVLEVIDENTN